MEEKRKIYVGCMERSLVLQNSLAIFVESA